jgi:hypothetical protein
VCVCVKERETLVVGRQRAQDRSSPGKGERSVPTKLQCGISLAGLVPAPDRRIGMRRRLFASKDEECVKPSSDFALETLFRRHFHILHSPSIRLAAFVDPPRGRPKAYVWIRPQIWC